MSLFHISQLNQRCRPTQSCRQCLRLFKTSGRTFRACQYPFFNILESGSPTIYPYFFTELFCKDLSPVNTTSLLVMNEENCHLTHVVMLSIQTTNYCILLYIRTSVYKPALPARLTGFRHESELPVGYHCKSEFLPVIEWTHR